MKILNMFNVEFNLILCCHTWNTSSCLPFHSAQYNYQWEQYKFVICNMIADFDYLKTNKQNLYLIIVSYQIRTKIIIIILLHTNYNTI